MNSDEMTQRVLRSALRMVPDSVFDAAPAAVSDWLDKLADGVELRDGEEDAAILIIKAANIWGANLVTLDHGASVMRLIQVKTIKELIKEIAHGAK